MVDSFRSVPGHFYIHIPFLFISNSFWRSFWLSGFSYLTGTTAAFFTTSKAILLQLRSAPVKVLLNVMKGYAAPPPFT